jgi:hypothetical protein
MHRQVILVAAIVTLAPGTSQAATTVAQRAQAQQKGMSLFVGPGLGLGFFNPSDVNQYMENWLDSQGSYSVQEGFSGMVLNVVPRISVSFAPIKYLQLQAVGELGWGPKIVMVQNGESEFFNFMRYSVGLMVNGHLPLGNDRYSIYLGGGVLHHWMAFKDYDGSGLGYRGQLGIRFLGRRLIPELYVAFDYATASTGMPLNAGKITRSDGSVAMGPATGEMKLDYTGVTLGAIFYFAVL